jgi:hypothetical protein
VSSGSTTIPPKTQEVTGGDAGPPDIPDFGGIGGGCACNQTNSPIPFGLFFLLFFVVLLRKRKA